MEEIRNEEIFKGKLSGSDLDRFIINKKQESKSLFVLNIMAFSDNTIFDGDILTDKKFNLIGYSLWIKVSDKSFLKNFYNKLGKASINLENQSAPEGWKALDKVVPRK